MTKLNGVNVIIPAIATISYNGVNYVQSEEAAVKGDIIRIADDEGASDLTDGAYYEVNRVDSAGDPQITDDDGDNYDTARLDEDFVVFKRPETESPTEPSAAPTSIPTSLTTTLPSDYVIHAGSVYTKESRKANVGETVIIIANMTHHAFEVGSTTVIQELFRGNERVRGEDRANGWLSDKCYAVITPAESITLGGTVYNVEKRKAAVGDVILAIGSSGDGRYVAGDIGRTTDSHGIPDVTWNNGKENAISESRYVVLVPVVSAQQVSYVEVKRKANVGERIRIVNPTMSMNMYDKGSEFTVKRVDSDRTGDLRVDIGGNERLIVYLEYVVLEPAKIAAEPAEPERLKVGEYARVLTAEKDVVKGAIVRIEEDDRDSVPFKGRDISGTNEWDWFRPTQIERVSPAEVEAVRKQAEKSALKVAELAKWSAIGRKVGEIKAGDMVRVLNPLGSSLEIGEITTVVTPDGTDSPDVRHKGGGTRYAEVELIAPVESLFSAK
ncbi:hypothetical protein [Paenibacillus agricola]|uniref:Uncharacterized protein n=1 Tax=Paenibacillus agricola TaxID=2716264 RepID=A0ABX0J733_9BACL|nr:hypothetical protein [Paenibacillus agricola]NHN31171.1 hypothetical protein [Paenibacillus agricola]